MKENYNLFLDDYRHPWDCIGYVRFYGIRPDIYVSKEWVIVKNYEDFVKHIEENGLPLTISFDHDLHDEHYCPNEFFNDYDAWAATQNFTHKTGLECLEWFIEYCKDNNHTPPEIYVHSMNDCRRGRMNKILTNFKENGLEINKGNIEG